MSTVFINQLMFFYYYFHLDNIFDKRIPYYALVPSRQSIVYMASPRAL